MNDLNAEEINRIKELASTFFPECRFREDEESLQTVDGVEIVHDKRQVLSYLQTMLFEEHLVEVHIDRATRAFFAHVLDDFPDPEMEEEVESDTVVVESEYEPGSYLKKGESLLLSPLTPGIGNPKIRMAKHIVIRFFKGTTAIELGCTFLRQDTVNNAPVLRLNFPLIGSVNRNFRLFRVKAPQSIEAKVSVRQQSATSISEKYYQIFDVSPDGIAFEVPAENHPFSIGEAVNMAVMLEGIDNLSVSGAIRNITKVRDKKGYRTICGVQFDLETRALAQELERLTAAIQRLHLREIAEKTADLQGITIMQ